MIIDWDDAYNNRGHIPGGDDYPPKWEKAAAAFRQAMTAGGQAELDIPYGPGERNRMDLYRPQGESRGLLVHVHGGYWRLFSKNDWSHMMAGPLARGWTVVTPSYTLCPDIRIGGIVGEIASAIQKAAALVPDGPLRLSGHSAGGHLVARMACADGPLDESARQRLDRVVCISGVFDLRPLLNLAYNDDFKLDEREAVAESPALLRPIAGLPVHCWVGADERPEFLRHNALLANIWAGLGADMHRHEEAARNHFTIVEDLIDPRSALSTVVAGD